MPAIETRPVPFSLPELGKFTHLVFTSAPGVRAFFQGLWAAGKDGRSLFGLRLLAVGKETAAALEERGLRADFVPSVFTGEQLAREALESGEIGQESRPLWLVRQRALP